MKISAIQAAQLVGRNERRIRDWIAHRRLPAVKVGQAWQIDIDDLEQIPGISIDLERLALLQQHEATTPHGLLNRVDDLENLVKGLQSEVVALKARVDDIERQRNRSMSSAEHVLALLHAEHATSADQTDYGAANTHVPRYDALPEAAAGSEIQPSQGSIRVKQFALMHKVHAAVLAYQIETGKVEDTALHMANGRRAHWLTLSQQQATIAFWRRNGTHFIPCPFCPHNARAEPS